MKKLVALGVAWGTLGLSAAVSAAPLSLDEAVRMALKNNLGLEQARVNVKSAEADVTGARSSFLPRATWNVNWVRPEFPFVSFVQSEVVEFDQQFSSNARIGITVFDGLGNIASYRQASRARTAAEESWQGTAQGVVYEAAVRFFDIKKKEGLVAVQVEARDLSQEQLKKTEAMKELGAATQADVFKAEVDHANNRLAALRAERDLAVAQSSLATYLGFDPREVITLQDEELDVDRRYDLDAASGLALEINPWLKAAQRELESREQGVTVQKSARYPSLTLSANHNYADFEIDRLRPGINSSWTYAAAVNLTVFDGLLTKSNIRRAQANVRQSRVALEDTRREVLFRVRQAHLDLDISRESILVSEEAVQSSEEDLRFAQERYKIGEGTILDVIDAQVNLTRSRTDFVTAKFDARLALLNLRNAIGDLPVPEDVEE